eukprot:TRINITY_DN7047_c0_g3_i1.p1 TRINITY_DN7047_c0_g3~~TRINITY_DN7047_c0_g3_i1.p1  ORF type:complete len:424 (-),score=106.23 TRINITY_DN7047_c0_g3_i1:129-1400(-)
MASKHQEDPEQQPLLQDRRCRSETEQMLVEPDDSMTYDARKLVTFEVLSEIRGTVWTKGTLWKQMALLVTVSLFTSVWVVVSIKEPEKLDVSKFQKIAGFLKVIVGLLLSFFLSSSVNRWYRCTNGFQELFDAIRSLQMQLNALGVPKERVHLLMRYCILSARCLNIDLLADTMTPEERAAYSEKSWNDLITTDENSSVAWSNPSASLAKVYPKERQALEKCEDPAQTLWIWVTSLLTRMSQDGDIPPMPTPTYGKIIGIAEAAYKGIREVRSSVCVQPPYVYVQMMAMLVAVNNLICAISFGMTLGVTEGVVLSRYHVNPMARKGGDASSQAVSQALQDAGISLVLSFVGPFLYQALLEVCVCIAQPFAGAGEEGASTAGRIPADQLLYQLEKDLRDAELMTESLPCWQQPFFKAPAAAPAK